MPDLVAIIGGKRSPVIEHELKLIHQLEVPYLIPWAAAEHLTANGENPNFVFRISLNDQDASTFLVDAGLKQGKRLALVFEKTMWGQGNSKRMLAHLSQRGLEPVGSYQFDLNQQSFNQIIQELLSLGAESLVMVGNPNDSRRFLNQLFKVLPNIKVASHWGILGSSISQEDMTLFTDKSVIFPQTIFLSPPNTEKGRQISINYHKHFRSKPEALLQVSSGFAHAYDLVYMLTSAIRQTGSLNRKAVRSALENLPTYEGLVKKYQKPFTIKTP